MIEKADATPAVDDGVPDNPGVTLVLHGNAAVGEIRYEVVHDDRRGAVAQNNPVVVAAGKKVPDNYGRAARRIDYVVVSRIQKSVSADQRRRGALAVHVDVVIVPVVIGEEGIFHE